MTGVGGRRAAAGEHLQRAAELLRGDKLDEAEREIESAIRIRATICARATCAGCFLFARRYDEALSVYHELCGAYPADAALRLTSASSSCASGATRGGRTEAVVASEPDNPRAQGYLGLALCVPANWRRRATLPQGGAGGAGGQVEERMRPRRRGGGARMDLRRAATRARGCSTPTAVRRRRAGEPVDEAKRGGAWQLRVPGERPPAGARGAVAVGRFEPWCCRAVAGRRVPTARLLRAGGIGEPFASPRAACW